MDEPRRSPATGAALFLRRTAPPPALCGFLLLLALLFTASYAAGASAGPVAPGMHGSAGTSGTGTDPGTGTGSGSGGADDMGDGGGGGDMGGMGDTHEEGR
ncbi:hypothetical protein [Streptomyces sp. NPDC047070]|uniref:hypothetical protein n=1 Tax=Streptomyces sp. NPDC047070 TaxID=3154923 RepID=UPI00345185A9